MRMDTGHHRLSELFQQLGLQDDPPSIAAFIAANRPLPPGKTVMEASFWSPSQAALLRQKHCEDADWAAVVDQLGLMLSR